MNLETKLETIWACHDSIKTPAVQGQIVGSCNKEVELLAKEVGMDSLDALRKVDTIYQRFAEKHGLNVLAFRRYWYLQVALLGKGMANELFKRVGWPKPND